MADAIAKVDFLAPHAKVLSRITGILVILVGILVTLGWILSIPNLTSIYGGITMKSNTAVSFMLAGVALLGVGSRHKYLGLTAKICAVIIAMIGLLTLSEHLLGWDLHIDQILFKENPGAEATTSPGRMGITSASCFAMFGVALLLLHYRKYISVAQTLTMIAGMWVLIAIVGYAYQAQQLFGVARFTGIALLSAVAHFLVCLGILAATSNEGMISIVSENGLAGILVRRLIVIGIIVPLVLGWLRIAGQRAGYFDLGLGTALLVIAIITVFIIGVWQEAIRLRTVEKEREATAALAKAGEERLRQHAALIELSQEAIFVWKRDDTIVEWNHGSEKLYGYTKEDAIGRVSNELLKTEFPGSFEKYLKDLSSNGFWSGELRHKTSDGRTVLVESRQQLTESDGVALVLETNRDITSRREAEKFLGEQRELLNVTLASVGDAVIVTDATGSITFLNSVAQSLTGWGEDAQGKAVQDVFNVLLEETGEKIDNPALRAIQDGMIVGLANHTILVKKDGARIPVDDSAAPIKDAEGRTIGAVLIFRDVSERRTAERTRALLAGIVESSDDAIISKTLDGNIQSWNMGAERVFEYTASEVIGKSITIIIPPDRLQEERTIIEKLRRGERVEHFETVRITKSGKQIPISLTVSPIRNSRGEVIGASKTARDITQRKRIEYEREQLLLREQQLRNEAQTTNRIKDEFLTTISHELRTPLNAILGWSTLLKRDGVNESSSTQGMEAIERNAKSQAQLIEDLLDVSRMISGKLRLDIKSVAVTPIINAAIDSVRPAADAKDIDLRLIVDTSVRELNVDEARLQQVMWNLLSNSIKFTPRGGRAEIHVSRKDSMAEISVSDTGEGIPKQFLPYAFDRFQQADGSTTRRHGGLGLGLAITRHLVEMHGGTIEAESEGAGHGSTFRVLLPISKGMTGELDPEVVLRNASGTAPKNVPEPNLAGVKVLAIDDAEDSRDMLKAVLEQFGANVITASSTRDGFELLTTWKPDVVVCDIGMPEEDGYCFIRKLRSLGPADGGTTPAIALTGYVRVEDRMRALDAGYQMFVPKPIEAAELVTLVDALRVERKTPL